MASRVSSEIRKQEIVRAALETIGEHGVEGATISRIAAGVGVTPAALYSHFENRHAILLSALDEVYEEVFDSFRASSSGDPAERVKEIMVTHTEKVREQDKTSHAHLFLEFVASAPKEDLREALREKEYSATSYLASTVAELKQQGGLPPSVDPELVAWLIAAWAWTGDVASSIGVTSIWCEQVSPQLMGLILRTLSGTAEREPDAPRVERSRTKEETADGLPDGAVFTLEETADILKLPIEVVESLTSDGQIRSLRLGGVTRIPRRALFACLQSTTTEKL